MAIKSRHPHMPFGNLTFAAALAVILANGLVFHDVDSIIYGLIFNFLSSYIINRMNVRFQRLYDGFDCDERQPRRVQDDRRKNRPRFHDIERLRRLFPEMGAMWCCVPAAPSSCISSTHETKAH